MGVKGTVPWNKGKIGVYSEDTRKKISQSLKGNVPWNKGIKTGTPSWNSGMHKTHCKYGHPLSGDNLQISPNGAYRCIICKKENALISNKKITKLEIREAHLQSFYKMTLADYEDLYKKQDGRCAVCRRPLISGKGSHIDHDHECCSGAKSCGKCIRGILCRGCNHGLGQFKDNVEVMKAAIAYLESKGVS